MRSGLTEDATIINPLHAVLADDDGFDEFWAG